MKSRWIEIGLHCVFWIATAWLFSGSFSIQMHQRLVINSVETINIVRNSGLILQILTCVTIGVIVFYITSWSLLRANEIKRQSIVYALLVLCIGILLAYLVSEFNYVSNQPPLPKAIALGIITFYFTVSIAYSIAKLWYRNHEREQQLILDKKQTELTLLRNQLQPHFLFNALNNLLSMVKQEENPKLASSFERLSQLLRYVIEETQSEKVSVRKEIAFLKNYIELQKLRFNENEVEVNLTIDGNFIEQKIEFGLFITFVENAFKYGTEPEQTAEIDIHFDLKKENQINFEIKNKIMMQNIIGNKTGIETTRRRLELIYPNKHQLIIQQDKDFMVTLNIETA